MHKVLEVINKQIFLVERWSRKHLSGLFIFNLVAVILLLLHSAGYFTPFFTLTINVIFFILFFLTIVLLGARSRELIIIAAIFWFLTFFFKVLQINTWAERTAIYFFQVLVLAIIVFILENRGKSSVET